MNIAFITNPSVQCGVAQYGLDIVAALQGFSRHTVTSYPLADRHDFEAARADIAAADLALYNYHPTTLGFLTKAGIHSVGNPAVGLLHEFDYSTAYTALADHFRYRIAPDPSLVSRVPGLWSVPRIVPQIPVAAPDNDVFTIGSFGFATPGKNYEEIVRLAARHFARARVRLHIPNSFYCDKDGRLAKEVITRCRQMTDGRVELAFSGEYLSPEELVAFLAGNDLNIFLYDNQSGRGISSVLDYALAAERPLALSNSAMFRHVRTFAPELFLDISPLDRILNDGAGSCRRLKALWTPENAARAFDEAFEAAVEDFARPHTHRVNTILTDDFREALRPREEEMKQRCPDVFARKLPRANVQQAFVLEQVERHVKAGGAILCVGYNEDTAYFTLKEKGYAVDAIDPEFDTDLDGFFRQHHGKRYYNCIFSTSVIEHVADDETFISQIAQLLAPGGVAILTMDFREDYQDGVLIPAADERFYTSDRLLGAFVPLLHGCTLLDIPDWNEHEPDFDYEGCRYGFATLVFRKNAALPDSVTADYERQTVRLLRKTDKQLRELASKYALATQQLATAIAERNMARRERDINAQERDQILHSLSWRVTKPLRFAKLCLRNPHAAARKVKEKVKTLPGAHRLRKPYRYLQLLRNDPHDFWLRVKRKLAWYFGRRQPDALPMTKTQNEQDIAAMLQNKMQGISFGKRLTGAKDEN